MNQLGSKQKSSIMPAASIAISEADIGTFAVTSMAAEEGQVRNLAQSTSEECVLLTWTNLCRIVDPQLAMVF
jgi:hypothetical protein